jgi:hypothetical protein
MNPWPETFRRSLSTLFLGLLALGLIASCGARVAHATEGPVTMTNYTDPGQMMEWGNRSHWKQPWRSYLDTTPATTLINAIGINFNIPNHKGPTLTATAKLLGDSGFKRARVEVGWNNIAFDDPSHLIPYNREGLEMSLDALKENGIRPLILLNANSGGPCPSKPETIELTKPAEKGDTAIHIAPADVGKIVPGRTGIRSGGTAANYLFTSVQPDGTVQLSAPLGEIWQSDRSRPVVTSLPAGALEVETLLYEPFRQPTLPDGSHNPAFEPTMKAWLQYVGVVTREVKAILGSEEFDVEIWNELSFGSRFLNLSAYYKPNVQPASQSYAEREILSRTVAYLRDPAHGVPHIGIGNGFSNQSPAWSGETSPPGLTAIDKHPYHGWDSYPTSAQINGNRPLNAVGEPTGWKDSAGQWHESFTPSYQSFFPEYFLSALQTETLVHDLSPTPSTTGSSVIHGRETSPKDSSAPSYWITEVNLDPASGPAHGMMSPSDIRHVASKDALRYLTAYVNKGVTALDFYAAQAGNLSLVDPSFFSAVKAAPSTYPGDEQGGETTTAISRLVDAMKGSRPIASPRSLSLAELTDYSGNVQFEGNGTEAYRPLYNREVFGFFPFQVNSHRFVIPVYVMTRNVTQEYQHGSTSPTRFDLPAETYRLKIAGVDGVGAEISATDPLTGESVPVDVLGTEAGSFTVKLDVTDSPRLLTIQEAAPDTGDGESAPPQDDPPSPPPDDPPVDPGPEPPVEPAPEPPVDPAPEPPSDPPHPAPEAGGSGQPGSDAGHSSPSKPTGPDKGIKESSTNFPSVHLTIRSRTTLIRQGHLTALVTCSQACSPYVKGRLRIGGRVLPMRPLPSRTSRRVLDAGTRAVVVLGGARQVAVQVREALERGQRVTVAVEAYVGGTGGGSPAAIQNLVLPPR